MATEFIGIKVGSETASENAKGDREYEAVYIVDVLGHALGPGEKPPTLIEVKRTAGLPIVGLRYLYDYGAICTSVDARRRANSQTICDVRCRWETAPLKNQKPSDKKDLAPWEESPEPEWGPVPFEMVSPVDLKGKKFADTAGTPFDPPPPIPQDNQVLTILRNEIGFSPQDARFYGNTINDRGWFGFPKYAVKLLQPVASGRWYKSQLYWQVTYRLEIMCGWVWSDTTNKFVQMLWEPYAVPNLGPMHIPEGGGEAEHNTDANGDPDTIHRGLDGDGHLLDPNDPTWWLGFTRFREANFGDYLDWLGNPHSAHKRRR